MTRTLAAVLVAVWAGCLATPAQAGESVRDVQLALDRHLAAGAADVQLVGGPGSAGYAEAFGFYLRGGDFALRTNLTLQARYEAWTWADTASGKQGLPGGATDGGDLSGFSLPRATLSFSGEAPCNMAYNLELDFGHFGRDTTPPGQAENLGSNQQALHFANTRTAWIEWTSGRWFALRAGLLPTATTRQLMTSPERQQFVDVSLASALVGSTMPGYTDRNRDLGIALHGTLGSECNLDYLLTITNGDGGDAIRNVLDPRTSDNLAYSFRLNWAFAKLLGYQEGALRQETCGWYGEVGAWAHYYEDRRDKTHTVFADAIRWGLDLAVGYGGFSFTGAVTVASTELVPDTDDVNYLAILAQIGYHFPGTAWEVAARYSSYDVDNGVPFAPLPRSQHPLPDGGVSEIAVAVNYYVNGHGNKLTLDASLVSGSDARSRLLLDPYAGYPGPRGNAGQGGDDFGLLLRFQWQLAL